MFVWTWVLTALCLAGALLALAPVVPVIRLALRLKARVNDIQHARFFVSLESLQLQRVRVEQLSAQAGPLTGRATAAVRRMRDAVHDSGAVQMRDTLRGTGAELTDLIESLR